MVKKTALSFAGIVVLVALGSAAYFYNNPAVSQAPAALLPPAAVPDNTILAGSVTAVSKSSITIRKQDASSATIGIAASTAVTKSQSTGGSVPGQASDLAVGMMVLINPSGSDPSTAQSIIILSPPPATP